MNFRDLLDTMARSSAEAVSTLAKSSDEIEKFRDYLYVETEIEKQFVASLVGVSNSNQIVFLCGSSGDGKSQLLRRYYEPYEEKFSIHLNATNTCRSAQNTA